LSIPRSSYVIYAAIAETLAGEYHLKTPAWVSEPYYYLTRDKAEWGGFSNPSKAFRDALTEVTPAAFAKRNVFVSANALSRA
jgi:hypothetical protein